MDGLAEIDRIQAFLTQIESLRQVAPLYESAIEGVRRAGHDLNLNTHFAGVVERYLSAPTQEKIRVATDVVDRFSKIASLGVILGAREKLRVAQREVWRQERERRAAQERQEQERRQVDRDAAARRARADREELRRLTREIAEEEKALAAEEKEMEADFAAAAKEARKAFETASGELEAQLRKAREDLGSAHAATERNREEVAPKRSAEPEATPSTKKKSLFSRFFGRD